MSNDATRHLHVVTGDEAELLEKRARARARFLRRYRPGESRRAMRSALDRLAGNFSGGALCGSTFPWEALCDSDLAEEVWEATAHGRSAKTDEPYSTATAKRDAVALRMMLRCCWAEGLLSYEQYVLASSFKAGTRVWAPPPGRTLTDDEVGRLISYDPPHACPVLCARDRALILTMAATGARRSEVSHMLTKNVDLEEMKIYLEVTKNGKPRDAWLHPSTAISLRLWLAFRGNAEGPLFVALSRTARPLLDRRLSDHQIWKILRKRSQDCGIGVVTPHDMRRFVVSRLLEGGKDLAMVSRIVGHSDPAVTQLYDRRGAQAMRDAIADLPLSRASAM